MDIKEQLNNLEAQQKALQKAIDDLKNQIAIEDKETYKDGLLQPKDSKDYYFFSDILIGANSGYLSLKKHNPSSSYKDKLIDNGLIFTSLNEAETHQKKLRAFSKCLSVQKFLNGGKDLEWGNEEQRKYYMYIYHGEFGGVDSHTDLDCSIFNFKDNESVKKFYEWCKPELIILDIIKE